MKIKMIILSVITASILLLGAAGCANNQPTEATPTGDTSWSKVESSGVLTVGTSSGYPPFEYYSDRRTLTGFDIALIYAVGDKLGVNVKLHDFAFDGLGSALSVGQIDAAIAAISVTPERQQQVNFSNVYYVGLDGILAQKGSSITSVKTVQDMANKRVGVERDSVYQSWVQTNLVNTGLIAPNQMFVYAQAKDAVNDLSLGRLDLVITDLQPAIASTNFYGVVLVGQGLDQQRMAIAMPLNANELTAKINQALTDLQNAGVIAMLEKQYLNLDPADAQPVPTPQPTAPPAAPTPTRVPTAVPPTGCFDAMKYIKDLTFDDGNGTFYPDVQPNQSFQKGWRIQNTGTCTWNSTYSLRFVSGTQMNGQPTAIQGNVAPGAMYDIYVNLKAPSSPGQYSGQWQMFNPQNLGFGERVWVMVEVVGPTSVPPTKVPPTATKPAPTQVPPTQAPPTEAPPVINSFTATPSTVAIGNVITVSWSFTGQSLASAKLTRINPDGSTTPLYGGADVPLTGTYEDLAAVAGTTTYKLVVSSEFSGNASQTATVQVTQ